MPIAIQLKDLTNVYQDNSYVNISNRTCIVTFSGNRILGSDLGINFLHLLSPTKCICLP